MATAPHLRPVSSLLRDLYPFHKKVEFKKLKLTFIFDKNQFSLKILQMHNIKNKVNSNNYIYKPDYKTESKTSSVLQ